jgi:hypothetical protein
VLELGVSGLDQAVLASQVDDRHRHHLAPSSTARSPSGLAAQVAKSGLCFGVPSGATWISGWMLGTR